MVLKVAHDILSIFPKNNFEYCFCYGSGAFKQANSVGGIPMLDMMFIVKNPLHFHQENLTRHSDHYSILKYLGPTYVTRIQEDWVAKIYYNTLVTFNGVTFKYGIINRNHFITDLLDWCNLYVAGRLHKPVAVLVQSSDHELLSAVRMNLYSAVHTALLLLPEYFSEIEFYQAIANISYAGDFRMIFGEDKNKISNIVVPQIDHVRNLYTGIIASLKDFVYIPENQISRNCQQNSSPEARWHHLNNLPRTPQKQLVKFYNRRSGLHQDAEDVLRTVSHHTDVGNVLNDCLRKIVWSSSIKQSLKGFVTAGLMKSLRYSGRKIYKMLSSVPK